MDDSEMGVDREPPPAGLVAAAEQDYHAILGELATLTDRVRALMEGGFTEFEAVTDVWLTLRLQDQGRASFLGAAAIMRLAKADDRHGSKKPKRGGAGR
jgi:hypothetical protein